jgi:hypothetical protein
MSLVEIETMCASLEQAWRRHDYDDARFPELAARALETACLHGSIGIDRIAAELANFHADHHLGSHGADTVIGLRRYPRFSVFVHVWFDKLASSHCHSWAGAFQVLSGNSLHARYAFDSAERIGPGLQLGATHLLEARVLGAGAVEAVAPGPRYIHAIAHLDEPCVSVSIRAHTTTGHRTMDLFRPGVLVASEVTDRDLVERLKMTAVVARWNSDALPSWLATAVGDADLESCWHLLARGHELVGAAGLEDALVAGRRRHGARFESLASALADVGRIVMTLKARAAVRDPETRFFLGALYVADSRATFDALVRDRCGADGPAFVARWIDTLFGADRPLLGIAITGVTREAFDLLAAGVGEQVATERLRAAYRVSSPEQLSGLLGLVKTVGTNPLLRALYPC